MDKKNDSRRRINRIQSSDYDTPVKDAPGRRQRTSKTDPNVRRRTSGTKNGNKSGKVRRTQAIRHLKKAQGRSPVRGAIRENVKADGARNSR